MSLYVEIQLVKPRQSLGFVATAVTSEIIIIIIIIIIIMIMIY